MKLSNKVDIPLLLLALVLSLTIFALYHLKIEKQESSLKKSVVSKNNLKELGKYCDRFQKTFPDQKSRAELFPNIENLCIFFKNGTSNTDGNKNE